MSMKRKIFAVVPVLVSVHLMSGCQRCASDTKPDQVNAVDAVEQAPPARPGGMRLQSAEPGFVAPPEDAVQLPNGWLTKVLRPGTILLPIGEADRIALHLKGWTGGKQFVNTEQTGTPVRETLRTLGVPGAADVVKLMRVGERRMVWGKVADGVSVRPGWPRGEFAVEIELLEVKHGSAPNAPAMRAPEEIKPPPEARRTASGLAWVQLNAPAGNNGPNPSPSDVVELELNLWTRVGQTLGSGQQLRRRFTPATMPFCLAEIVLQMGPGERWRVWLPETIARRLPLELPRNLAIIEVELIQIH